MAAGPIISQQIDGETMETVTLYFLVTYYAQLMLNKWLYHSYDNNK